jgi:hypothetical protein
MASTPDIESARLSMLEARTALEDYESRKGFVYSDEHLRRIEVFTKAHSHLPKALSEPTLNKARAEPHAWCPSIPREAWEALQGLEGIPQEQEQF